jgi:hypothetical protein
MSIKCVLGFHTWDGCICTQCDKINDDFHNWSIDCGKCSKCGKIREESYHYWSNDCKCSKCGKTRDHDWSRDCENCSKCGKVESHHDWTKDCEKCSKCGKIREEEHRWNGCKCAICGIERNENHSWDRCKCSICGKINHSWDGSNCSNCGQIKVEINAGMSYAQVLQLLGSPNAKNYGYELDPRLAGTSYGNQIYLTFNLPYGMYNIIIDGNTVSKSYFY